jgi:hypothetical protein
MTQYPPPMLQRFPATLKALQARVPKLETRTAGIDSGFPLAVLPGVIDPGNAGSGDPNVYVNGASTLTGPYQHLASYTPAAGDSVLLAPVEVFQTYVILGKYL